MADKEVSSLTDTQLRERLASFPGQDVPPITQSTRKPLERRLMKLMGAGTPNSKSPPVSPPVTPKSNTLPATPSRVAPVKRTPSPPIEPLPRSVVKPISPRKPARSGAAFSSDEDDEVPAPVNAPIYAPDATVGTPIRGYLNGRFIGSSKPDGPSASSDIETTNRSFGLSSWLTSTRRSTPRTSTPQERRIGQSVQDSFGSMTPIRDEGGLRPRSVLGRPPLASFSPNRAEDTPSPTSQRRGFLSRLIGDPIHLTPQTRDQGHTRHSPPRPRPLQFLNTSVKDEANWFSRHSTILLWGLVALFFLATGLYYVRMKWNSTDLDTSLFRYKLDRTSEDDNFFPCAADRPGQDVSRLGEVCYEPEEIIHSLEMTRALLKHLAKLKGEALCEGKGKIRMAVPEARSFAVDAVPGGDAKDFTRAVHLMVANPHWGIRALDMHGKPTTVKEDVREFESEFASKTWACRWKEAVANLFVKIALVVLGTAAVVLGVWLFLYYLKQRSQRKVQVYEMVHRIIDIVQNNYKTAKKEGRSPTYSVVSHVREELLPHGAERKKLLSLWKDAVSYINSHESRISCDIDQINGEDFEVWNWLPTKSEQSEPSSTGSTSHAVGCASAVNGAERIPSKPRNRFWGGGPTPAKSIVAENITAATPCLKVRGMFDGSEENQSDTASWTPEIENAILERCHGIARIYDITVDPTSPEGIVYIKLASNEDARNAYMALAGQYFADRLVKVKFLKLDRYHQRFAESVNKNVPLAPSKLKAW